jgi:hypothetical protein
MVVNRNNSALDQEAPEASALDLLLLFQQAITQPLNMPLLELPKSVQHNYTDQKQIATDKQIDQTQIATRCSPRIQSKIKKHKSALRVAQEMLAKKWSILDVEKEIEELTL